MTTATTTATVSTPSLTPTLIPALAPEIALPVIAPAPAPAAILIPYCCACDGLLTPDGAGCVCEPGYAAIIGAPRIRECEPADLCEYCDRYRARGYAFNPESNRPMRQCKICFARNVYEERKRWGDLPDHSGMDCDIFGKRPEDYAPESADEFDVDGDMDTEDIGYRRTPLERQMEDLERDMEESAQGPDWGGVELTYRDARDLG